MNRVDRLLALILYLESHPLCTAEELASHFALSTRTIYRDLAALRWMGVPVMGEPGMGYSISREYRVPPVAFTREEALALVTGAILVRGFAPGAVSEHMDSAIMKVRAVLGSEYGGHALRVERSTSITANSARVGDVSQAVLQQALAERRLLRFSYETGQAKRSRARVVEPHGLIFYLDRWHLIAWCHLREDFRDFRTDRMSGLELLKDRFVGREGFRVAEYIESMPQPNLRARVLFSPEAADRARREWWLGTEEVASESGGSVLALAAVDWKWLAGWLLSFGTEATVIEPEELREILIDLARETVGHHENTKPS